MPWSARNATRFENSGRHVQFRKLVTVHAAPNYDRRSPWMRVAADRQRFERRIGQTEKLLRPILMRKQMELLCDTLEMCKIVDDAETIV